MEKPKAKPVLSFEEIMAQSDKDEKIAKKYKPKKEKKEVSAELSPEERAEFEKKMDEYLDKQVEATNDPKMFAKVLETGEKLYASPYVTKEDKEMYWNQLTSAENMEEVTKYEKEINEKLEISEVVKYATKITEEIEASSLSDEEKDSLYSLVIESTNVEEIKKARKKVESQLFTFKGNKVEFSNNKLTLGHIFPSESEKSVILVDGKPAFLNPKLEIDGKAQYCYAAVTGDLGERAKVYSNNTEVQMLTREQSAKYFEHGIPKPGQVAGSTVKQLAYEGGKTKTPAKARTEVAKVAKNEHEEL